MLNIALLLLAFMLAGFSVAPAAPHAPTSRSMNDGGPRLRLDDDRSKALLLDGLQRSDTLRQIVEEIEQGDVIIYVQMQPGMKRQLAGCLTWITATKTFRYVRISLNRGLTTDLQIATLAHELQHAREVVREPSIVSAATLTAYYATHGMSMPAHSGWDTQAARDAGEDVRRELAGRRTSRVAESIQDFDPTK